MENSILTAWNDINNIVKDKKVDLLLQKIHYRM